MWPLPDRLEIRFVFGASFRWKPYFHKYFVIKGFEFSWIGVFINVVW